MTQPTTGQGGTLRLVFDGTTVTAEPGQELTIGRDRACDVTVVDTRASRRHVQVRFEDDQWVAVDLGSSNGTYIAGRRVPAHAPVPLGSGGSLRLGAEDGPQVRIQVQPAPSSTGGPVSGGSRHSGPAASGAGPGSTDSGGTPLPGAPRSGPLPTRRSRKEAEQASGPITPTPPSSPGSTAPTPQGPASGESTSNPSTGAMLPAKPGQHAGVVFERWSLSDGPQGRTGGQPQSTLTGQVPQVLPMAPTTSGSGVLTIGRGLENQIVVDDLLASRQHVRLTPRQGGGYDVEDLGSRNGTYVNGQRVDRAFLSEGGLLAVGHSRFTVRQGQLVASVDEGDVNFVANHLSFTLDGGKKLLDDITFALEGSSLLAVVGPSGAGKSTLLKALTGSQQATEGEVYYDGRDLYENYDDLRHRIGVVPQDDVVHRQLTVTQALRYAAELRFPDDLDKHLRDERVDEVIEELGLTQHKDTRVDRLSGGQRKRTSVALELLTRPSLLFLDEPTSGLDPGLDKQVMNLLRDLADGGRTVVVITHAVANLNVCDKVLLLAPGGKVAYFGPPDGMLGHFHAGDHADVFTEVARDPERAKAVFKNSPLMEEQVAAPLRAPRSHNAGPPEKPPRQQSIPSQLSTLARRHLKVILADRGYAAFMLIMPVVLGIITMVVPGEFGLGAQPATGSDGKPTSVESEPLQILVVLIVGAIFMGTAAAVRELVGERPIFLREKAVGLSPTAYVSSKLVIFGILTLIQSAILVFLVLLVKQPPAEAIMLGSPTLELIIVCWFTAFCAVSLGLLISSIVKTSEQVMPLLVVSVMAQLVLCGGLFPVTGRPVLEQLAWITPSRWGYAGAAGVTDVQTIFTRPGPDGQDVILGDGVDDALWQHEPMFFLLALAMLTVLGIALAAVALWKVNREDD